MSGIKFSRRRGTHAAPTSTLLFDSFEHGLDGLNGAGVNPNWQFVNVVGASVGTLAIVGATGGVTPVDGTHMLQVTTTIKEGGSRSGTDPGSGLTYSSPPNRPDYDMDFDIQPWNATGGVQGAKYAYEVSQGGTYTEGAYRALEFYVFPDPRCNDPLTTGGLGTDYGGLQIGAYSMAPSQKGLGNQEAHGWHGYFTILLPKTNGRWLKAKFFRAGGQRTAWPTPAAICDVAGTNGVAFIPYETIACSPSGVTLKFTNEQSPWSPTGVNQVWGLWTLYNAIPSAGDTITGLSSGAVRTISAAVRFSPGAYTSQGNTDTIGMWCGFDDRWAMHGGGHDEWYADTNATYWDRVTRFYIASIGQTLAVDPVIDYVDKLTWVDGANDDVVAVSNMGAFYDPALGKLFVSWEKNHDFHGKTWEVRTSTIDMHVNGLAAGTVWNTQVDNDPNYSLLSIYATISSPGGAPLYISVRDDSRLTFAQMVIETA